MQKFYLENVIFIALTAVYNIYWDYHNILWYVKLGIYAPQHMFKSSMILYFA